MAFNFDLFALPSLAVNQVLANMSLNSLINFAISSKNSENLVKWSNLYRKPTKFQLKYAFNRSQLIISFENGSSLFVSIGKLETLEEDDSNRRFLKNNKFLEDYMGGDGYYTYWQDVPTATKLFVEFLTNLFQFPIDSISIDKPSGINNEEFNSFLNWIPSTQILHVSTCKPFWNVKDVDKDEEKLMTIVSKNKNIQQLQLDFGSLNKQVNVDFTNTFYSNLTIGWASWLTLESVLNMECIELNVSETEFTSEDVNTMLKMWKKGWNHSMQSINILNETAFENPTILQQLNPDAVNGGKYEITRDTDGGIARIYTDVYRCTISVQPITSEPPAKRRRI